MKKILFILITLFTIACGKPDCDCYQIKHMGYREATKCEYYIVGNDCDMVGICEEWLYKYKECN
jgi:hypothetical protein